MTGLVALLLVVVLRLGAIRWRYVVPAVVLVLLFEAVVTRADAQALWDGQGGAKGWVQFENGAYAQVDAYRSDAIDVTVWDGQSGTLSKTYHTDGGWSDLGSSTANTNGPPLEVDNSKLGSWAKGAGAGLLTGAILGAIEFALAPDLVADGTVCGQAVDTQRALCLGGYELCNITVHGTREYYQSPNCYKSNSGDWTVYWHQNSDSPVQGVGSGTQTNLRSANHYPDTVWFPVRWVRLDKRTDEGHVALPDALGCLSDVHTCSFQPLGDDVAHEVAEELVPGFIDLPGGDVAPAVFRPIPLPPELAAKTLEELNPGGTIQPDQVTVSPSPQPTPTPHPGSNPGTGTNPGNNPGSGSSTVQVTFPDQMDVTVLNWPQLQVPGDDAFEPEDYETDVFDLPTASPGGKWIAASCPEPVVVTLAGQSVALPFDAMCDPVAWFGILLNLCGAITCGLIVMRA